MTREIRDFLLFDRKFNMAQLDCENIFAAAPQNLRLWRFYAQVKAEHATKMGRLHDVSR